MPVYCQEIVCLEFLEVKKSKGFAAWLMQKTGGRKEQREKDRKEVLALQKKVDTLIDMTTAVMRPKLLGTHCSRFPKGYCS